ncbi:unnamed protein product (macronuclear) [Paramecium tetraurelia]|uniref:Uncharacterized protein n=1 Tax=Paramecium tetraurelia TaxID=5888 RepID=A0BX48_PARTE|nr:uncharacterized protein GSPATT00032967001 [Paramecium tetraurelia]CAK63115.1 unnamed protein product [Paramecium tetraurelia]|eukprot:XP_001430513.1 hypothetical protein (macronuclear) [Paramecium tetraurelia strain d4-2]
MGNSSVRTSNACPQIIRINRLQYQLNFENENSFDNADGKSIATAAPNSPNHSHQIITEVIYVRRNIRRKAIIISNSSQNIDESEVQTEI